VLIRNNSSGCLDKGFLLYQKKKCKKTYAC
jgi:hypothetical protein